MSALAYYIYANIYILLFWLFFRFILRKETFFQGLRIYILSSVILSVILPLLAFHSNSNSVVYTYNPINLVVGSDFKVSNSVVTPVVTSEISWIGILKFIIASGCIITFSLTVFKHFRIYLLIKKSAFSSFGNLKLITSPEVHAPFLYHRNIVLPIILSKQETEIVIEHELQHYKLAHGVDNILIQIFQIVFWLNPFIYLLKKELKQVHEFQVDQEILKTDIDVSIYQLTLIKFSVGYQKFAIANRLSNSKIKNRIIMMNKNKNLSWKWKYLLFIPAFIMIFALVSFSQSNVKNNSSLPVEQADLTDSITIEYIYVPETLLKDIKDKDGVMVFINKNSQLLVDLKISSLENVQQTVYNNFLNKTSVKLDLTTNNLLKPGYQATRIYVRKDVKTNESDYNKLIENLSVCISKLQDFYSDKAFGKTYKVLSVDEQTQIRNLIQPRLYSIAPQQIE